MSKKYILVAALLAAGCSEDRAPAGGTADAGDAPVESTAGEAAATPCPEPRYSPTPAGVAVDRDFLVRTDKVYVTRAGAERRRTSLEILDGDPAEVARQVVAALVAQGARELEVEDRGDGTVRLAVNQRGVGRINISASEDLGRNPSHPRSVGIVAFDWPLTAGDEDDGSAAEAGIPDSGTPDDADQPEADPAA